MILLCTLAALAADAEWRANAGAQIDASSHGVADLGWRKGPWSVELLTDTLDARWQPSGDHGRSWIALRAEGGSAGLSSSVWVDGAPSPESSYFAHYFGGEAGSVRYGREGTWAGAQISAYDHLFTPMQGTTVPVPDARAVLSADAMIGWWQDYANLWVKGGASYSLGQEAPLSPHISFEARSTIPGRLVLRVELRAGWSSNPTETTLTRVGGLNPYVVPVAGAGWGEYWTEDYAAARVGPQLTAGPITAALVVDGAAFKDPRRTQDLRVAGTGLLLEAHKGRGFAELSGGYGLRVPRAEGVSPLSLWLRFGLDWGQGWRFSPPTAPSAE